MKCVNCIILMLFYAVWALNCPLLSLIPPLMLFCFGLQLLMLFCFGLQLLMLFYFGLQLLMLFCFGLQGAGTPGSGGGGRREGV